MVGGGGSTRGRGGGARGRVEAAAHRTHSAPPLAGAPRRAPPLPALSTGGFRPSPHDVVAVCIVH